MNNRWNMIPSLSPAIALSPAFETCALAFALALAFAIALAFALAFTFALAFALALPLDSSTIGFDALMGGGTFSTQLWQSKSTRQ